MSRFSRIDWTGSDYDSLLTELRIQLEEAWSAACTT